MNQPRRTVVGVDGSEPGTAAVRWAARRCAETGAGLRLVHAYVVPVMFPAAPFAAVPLRAQEAYEQAARALLAEAERVARAEAGAGPALEVDTQLVVGGPASALIDASAQAGLVVVGSRGHGGFAGLLLGSVGVQVSAHASCPTAVVRGADRSPGGPIVVGADGSPASDAALRFAFAEASRQRLPVLAVYAWSLPQPAGLGEALAVELSVGLDGAHRAEFERAAHDVLTAALAPMRTAFPEVEVRATVVADGPAAALVQAAEGATMVVIGSRGHGGFVGLLLGSTSQSVLHHAPCPVVLTRATG